MSAAAAVQAALVTGLSAASGIAGVAAGVYDGPPARAGFPYVAIGETVSFDWGHKSGAGRELRMAVTAWDEAGRSARLLGLMAAAAGAIEALPRDLDGWRVASVALLRERVVRDPAGPIAGIIEFRVRALAV
jgi:hypothetical protein